MIYGYCRVSTDLQDNERQRKDVETYAKAHGLEVNAWCQEVISSRKEEREIYKLIEMLQPRDVVIATEFSRLSRGGMIELMGIIGKFKKAKADLHITNGNHKINGEGKLDHGMSAIIFALGLAADIERDMISQRTKSGMATMKAQGYPNGKAGRPVGYRKLDGKQDEIQGLLAIGVTKKRLAERFNVTRVTLDKFIKGTLK